MQQEAQILFSNLDGLSYVAVFLIALAAGYLVPAPEEVVFILVGYGVALAGLNIYLVILVSVLGIVVSDSIAFYLGFKGSVWVEKFEKKINTRQLEKYKNLAHRHAGKTVFTSRFIPTLRVLVPILAGTIKMKWKTFFFFDVSAAIVNVGALILIGHVFNRQISVVLSRAESTQRILSILSIILIGTAISFIIRAVFFKKDA